MLNASDIKSISGYGIQKQLSDGSRKIMSIVEGIDYVDGKIQFNTLYRFRNQRIYG